MQTYYPYNIDDPQLVTEQLIIKDGMIILRHIPKAGTLIIDGFKEVDSPINLQSNEFFCYYSADSLYREANRLVYFYRGLSGQRVTCHYGAVGTPITADDMNEIKAHLDNGEHDPELNQRVTQLAQDLSELREEFANIDIDAELQEDVAALKVAVNALSAADIDIWHELDALNAADDDLAERVTAIEQKIDDTPADKTVNEIIFANKPHDGYNATGKQDFLTYVFGDDTPTPYSASGASAFIGYIF